LSLPMERSVGRVANGLLSLIRDQWSLVTKDRRRVGWLFGGGCWVFCCFWFFGGWCGVLGFFFGVVGGFFFFGPDSLPKAQGKGWGKTAGRLCGFSMTSGDRI